MKSYTNKKIKLSNLHDNVLLIESKIRTIKKLLFDIGYVQNQEATSGEFYYSEKKYCKEYYAEMIKAVIEINEILGIK